MNRTETLALRRHPERERVYISEDLRVFVEVPISPDGNGYPLVRLSPSDLVRRHTLVAETFIGPRPDGRVVRHKNGIPGDDRPDNLEWGTQRENCADTKRHGRTTAYRGKLTVEDVADIKKRRAAGERGVTLAAEFGVTESTICDIHRGRWHAEVPTR